MGIGTGQVSVIDLPPLPTGDNTAGRFKLTDGTNVAGVDSLNRQKVVQSEPATFYAIYDGIAPANNKYMATLWNGAASRKVVIQRIWYFQWTTSAVTGVGIQLEMRLITARTAGTSVTPLAADSSDSLTSGITADHNSTVVTDSTVIRRTVVMTEEAKTTAAQTLNSDTLGALDWNGLDGHTIWNKKDGVKGITLRNGQGLTLKCITSTTVGAISVIIEFTDEPA